MLVSNTYSRGLPFSFHQAPIGAGLESVALRTVDHRTIDGLYWQPPRSSAAKAVVICMHPRVDFTRHYTFPRLLDAGIACLGVKCRNPNNDIDTVHEELLVDLASAIAFVRSRSDAPVILLGNSGGAPLSAYYQAQACLSAERRIERAPSGQRTALAQADMPPADLMMYVAPHPGQGRVLAETIDPSLTDERDPLSTEPSLDMYDAANGFVPAPEWSQYDDSFLTRYRQAQRARVERLDARAKELIEVGRAAAREIRSPDFASLSTARQMQLQRQKALDPIMVIYRTMANPCYVDRRLDRSDRSYGSLISDRPDMMNMKLLGFARVCTPRAWLSTWSSRSSNADMERNLPSIVAPTFMAWATADREIYPVAHMAPLIAAIGATDRTVIAFKNARHYFEAPPDSVSNKDRDDLMDAVIAWIDKRL